MGNELILKRAQNAAIARDFQLAIRLYKSLLKENPSDVSLLNEIGSSYVKSGEDEKALKYYEQILTFAPHNVDAMNSMGAIYRRLKQYDDSIKILQKAVNEGANSVSVNYNLGFTYKEMGNFEEAIDAFSLVVDENPSDVLAHNHLGSIYYQQKLYQKSIQAFKKGLQIDPNHPILHYNLAKCYEAEKQYDDAVREYEAALRVKPGWMDALKDFSTLLIKCQKTKEAREVVKRTIELNPNDPNLLRLLGQIYLKEYDFDSAATSYSKALSLDEMNVETIMSLADALEKSQQPKDAVDVMSRAVDSNADNRDFKKQYVHALLSAEEYEEAYTHVDSLYRNNGEKDVQVLDLYGQYYICVDDEQSARKYFDRIPTIDPAYKLYLLEAANRYSQIGKIKQAEEYANRYISMNPKSPDAYNMLGNIYSKAGDKEKAIKSFGQGIAVSKNNVYAAKKKKELEQNLASDEKLDYLAAEDTDDDVDSIEFLQGEDENSDMSPFETVPEKPVVSRMPEEPEKSEELISDEPEEDELEEPVPPLMESAMEETEFPDLDDVEDADSYKTSDEFLDNPESTDISDILDEEKNDASDGGMPEMSGMVENSETPETSELSESPETPDSSDAANSFEPSDDIELPESREQASQIPQEPYKAPKKPAMENPYGNDVMDSALQSMENMRTMEKALKMQCDMLDNKVDNLKNQLSNELENKIKDRIDELKQEMKSIPESKPEPVAEPVPESEPEPVVESEPVEDMLPADESEAIEEMEAVENALPIGEPETIEETEPVEEIPSVEELVSDTGMDIVEDIAEDTDADVETMAGLEPVEEENVEDKKEFDFAESEDIIDNNDSGSGDDKVMDDKMTEIKNDFDFADVDNCFDAVPDELDAVPAEPEEDFSSVDDLFGLDSDSEFDTVDNIVQLPAEDAVVEENVSPEENTQIEETVAAESPEEDNLQIPELEDASEIHANIIEEDAPFEDIIDAAAEVASEADFPKTEEQKSFESLNPLEAVKVLLPRIEMMLKDTDYAYSHETELELFKKIKAFCDFLPEEEKKRYQNSRITMLLEFIIARLEGKPGLLAAAESLLKSGLLGDCLIDRIYEKQNELIEKKIELQEEVRAVLEYMKELADSLSSKTIAQALKAEADVVLNKLDCQPLC